MRMTEPVPAKYAGKCARTGQRYEVGTLIINKSGQRGQWELYESAQSQPQPSPTPQAATEPAPMPVPILAPPEPTLNPMPTTNLLSYDDAFEFLRAVETAQPSSAHTKRASRDVSSNAWTGTDSFEEAVTLGKSGWSEGVTAILKATETLPAIIPLTPDNGTAPGWNYDVCGDELDVSRFLSDEPECFSVREPTEGEGKIINLIVSLGFAGAVGPHAIRRRGASICAICYALESSGYNVQITLRVRTKFEKRHFSWQCTFKRADQPLELDRAAFFMTHPAILRRFDFALCESQPDCPSGYGRPDDSDQPSRPGKGATDIFVPGGSRDEDISPMRTLHLFREAGLLA